jgi:hypothetical protein
MVFSSSHKKSINQREQARNEPEMFSTPFAKYEPYSFVGFATEGNGYGFDPRFETSQYQQLGLFHTYFFTFFFIFGDRFLTRF